MQATRGITFSKGSSEKSSSKITSCLSSAADIQPSVADKGSGTLSSLSTEKPASSALCDSNESLNVCTNGRRASSPVISSCEKPTRRRRFLLPPPDHFPRGASAAAAGSSTSILREEILEISTGATQDFDASPHRPPALSDSMAPPDITAVRRRNSLAVVNSLVGMPATVQLLSDWEGNLSCCTRPEEDRFVTKINSNHQSILGFR